MNIDFSHIRSKCIELSAFLVDRFIWYGLMYWSIIAGVKTLDLY